MVAAAGQISSMLKFLCGESDHVCRLCLGSTERGQYCLEDSVRLKKPYYDVTLSFENMFYELGVQTDHSLPNVICMDCAAAAINSILFQKLCKHSEKMWNEVIEKLKQTLSESSLNSHDVETAYLVFTKTDKEIFTSKKKCATRTKAAALMKLKNIVTTQLKYIKKKKEKQNNRAAHYEYYANFEMERQANESRVKIPCPKCAKYFSSPILLEEHAQRVHYPKNIQCKRCSQMFSTMKMLKRHENNHHIAAICKRCFVQFPSKNALRSHMDKHELNKCERCSKVLINRQTYKLHMKMCGNPNQKDLKFFCDICGKGYCRKNSLRTHLKTDHGFGRVFSCSWCSKKYDAKSRLRNHIVKHTRERNFHCERCGGKFVTHAALIYHIRLHTGEKPFKCDECDETFLSASRRMDHRRRKHLAPSKQCSICNGLFVTKNQLKKHESRHHDPHSKLYIIKKQEVNSNMNNIEFINVSERMNQEHNY